MINIGSLLLWVFILSISVKNKILSYILEMSVMITAFVIVPYKFNTRVVNLTGCLVCVMNVVFWCCLIKRVVLCDLKVCL